MSHFAIKFFFPPRQDVRRHMHCTGEVRPCCRRGQRNTAARGIRAPLDTRRCSARHCSTQRHCSMRARMLESAPDNCSIELPYIHREFVVGPNESNVDRSAVTGSLEAVGLCDVVGP
jgi:hypothetical protein